MEIKGFKGRVPRFDSRHLPDNAAQIARNCKVENGNLKPFKGTTVVSTPAKAGTKKTIYLYRGSFWLHWITDVDVVPGPIAGDVQDRMYWTGDGVPKVSDASIITAGGGTEYPTNAYTLGIPAPTGAPTVGVAGTSSDSTQDESRAYVTTMVSGWGEEGPPSAASNIVTVGPGQTANLTGIAAVPAGAYNITHKRIYRTVTGTTTTEYKYVGVILAAATTFSDTVSIEAAAQTESLPSTLWDPPPTDMHSLKLHPSGFMVGISKKDICFSVPYMPHAWPIGYRIAMKSQPVGIGIFGNSVLVLTEGQPEVITGTDPEFLTKEQIEINQSCVSKRGITDVGYAVAYPSPDGLIVIGNGIAKNATEALLTREQWQALNPSSMIGAFHDGRFYGFTSVGSFVLDFTGEHLIDIDVTPTAAYSDLETDTLYLQVGDNIVSWDTGALMTQTWKSKLFDAKRPVTPPKVFKVVASAYPVTLNLYGDGSLKFTQSVTSSLPFRKPGKYRATTYEIQVQSATEIHAIRSADTMQGIAQ